MANQTPKLHMPGMRVFSFSVAGVLGLLLISGSMPAVLSDSTDRAIIDAPVDLITSSIKGVVSELAIKAGDPVTGGQKLALVQDNSVDPAKLIELNLKVADLDSRLANDQDAISSLRQSITKLDAQIESHKDAFIGALKDQVAGAKYTLAMKDGQVSIASKNYETNKALRAKGLMGGSAQNWASQVEIAQSDANAASTEVSSAQDMLNASAKGVYLGPEAGPLNSLVQERRDDGTKLAQFTAEVQSLQAEKNAVTALRDAEKQRIARISQSSLEAPNKGNVLNVNVHVGSAVSSGDAIARTVNCENAFVAAIFPEQKAPSLGTGTPVTVTSAGWNAPVRGTIMKLVPRDTASQNDNLAVPFPPTERRELYAYIRLARNSDAIGNGTCAVGKWASVSIDNGIMSAAGNLVQRTSGVAAATAANLYEAAWRVLPPKLGWGTGEAVASQPDSQPAGKPRVSATSWAGPAQFDPGQLR